MSGGGDGTAVIILGAMSPTDALNDLGVTRTRNGGQLRVWSQHATSVQLCIFDEDDADWIVRAKPMRRDSHGVWSVRSRRLVPGARYALRVRGPEGPTHRFDSDRLLLDPYARGLMRSPQGHWRSVVVDDPFDWAESTPPRIPMDHTVLYELHVRGFTRLLPQVPEALRGTYAGLAHPAAIEHLRRLGVTSVELLPVHQFESEQRLRTMGLTNYWGYNTLGFFAPHAAYATLTAQQRGPAAVLREFKGMVKLLHEAGIEVILDVVYNHTSEEGPAGPTRHLRGLDNAAYYRQTSEGDYIDTTGVGNTVNVSTPAAARLVLDSMRYWAAEVGVDGFRLDLATALGRDRRGDYRADHPLLTAMLNDPVISRTKLIAEPWDVGPGGWQVGGFPNGFSEWNDGYRDRVRTFWLTDVATARSEGRAAHGIGSFTQRLAGSEEVFGEDRGPVASVNFVTAHDGFTAADLVSYNQKHNLGNGEGNRDGTDANRSYNHGVEGPTDRPEVLEARRRALRNLLGTLLLSAGIPMLTAGDEFGRSQRGNNNAYCHDDPLTWVDWDLEPWQRDLLEVATTLVRLRRENPALRPVHYGRFGETVPNATQMDWYNKQGLAMEWADWDSPDERTVQYLAASTPKDEPFNRVLLIVHGLEDPVQVTLPEHEGVHSYTLLWDSARDDLKDAVVEHGSGSEMTIDGLSMRLFRAH